MDDDDLQQFNLRWHNHQNSVIGALGRMYNTGILTDVTLSASGTILKAHRLVLASCSQYFAQLFKDVEAENNTLVVVLGCEATDLRLLLSFMYTGEVTASRRNLPPLLRLAKALKVAGLTDADCTNPNPTLPEAATRADPEPETNSPINLELKTDANNDNSNSADNNSNYKINYEDIANTYKWTTAAEAVDDVVRNEEGLSKLDQIVQNLYSTHRIDSPISNIPVTPPILSSVTESLEPPYERKWRHVTVCTVCNKRLSNQYNLRVHMETHTGGRHACRACNHVSRSRDALRKHVAYRHPDSRLRGGMSKTDV